MPATMPVQTDWVRSVLFDRGYLARMRGDSVKVYLALLQASGGTPGRGVAVSLSQLTGRTRLTHPTVVQSLSRLEEMGLVGSTARRKGRVTTYHVSNPPPEGGGEGLAV